MKKIVANLGVLLGFVSSLAYSNGVIAQNLDHQTQHTQLAQSITAADDGTMTIVTKDGQTFNIDGGTLSDDGRNLFHSFKEFGLSPQQIANFLSHPHIQNILARVTGGNPSTIEGLIQVTGGKSNLFIMNPAGIIFGGGASLNVPADFSATTATAIGFGDNIFNAFGSNDYGSLVGSPTSFHFQNATGTIVNAADLSLVDGHNLSLLAGTVVNTGTIDTPSGTITIAAVPGTSKVRLSPAGSPLSLELELPTNSSGENIPITVLDLPELLTGNAEIHTGLSLNPNGDVQLNQTPIPTGSGTNIVSGKLTAGGGEIHLRGDTVGVVGGILDASATNGGSITVGGDNQGLGFNSSVTLIDANSQIRADGGNGDGGEIVVWSDATSRIYGDLSATGSNDGGLIETSSDGFLEITTTPDVTATFGNSGTWLIDPFNITIVGSSAIQPTNDLSSFVPNLNDTQIDVDLITAALTGGATVTISTNSGVGTQAGNITLATPLDYDGTGSNTLELLADGNITIDADAPIFDRDINTTPNDSLNLTLLADQNNDGIGAVIINGSISSRGGSLTAVGNDFDAAGVLVNQQILTGGGNVSLTGNSTNGIGVNVLQLVDSGGGEISIDGISGDSTGTVIDAQMFSNGGNLQIGGISNTGDGVIISSDANLNSGGGNLQIGGANQAQSNQNNGNGIQIDSAINSFGGDITLVGSSSSVDGVKIDAIVESNGGNISVSGTTTASQTNAQAVEINSRVTSGNGSISITGTAASNSDIVLEALLNSGTGDLTLTADNLELESNSAVAGSGNLLIQPNTVSTDLTVGGNTNSQTFLNEAELANIQTGFKSITIGRVDGSGTITLDTNGNGRNNLTFNDPLTVQSPFGNIVVNSPIRGNDNASVTLTSKTTNLNADIATNSNPIEINSDIILGADITLETTAQSNGGAAIDLNGTVDGDFDLTLDAGLGNIGINGDVGSTNPVANLTTSGSGTTQINTATIDTNVDIQFDQSVEIGTDTILNGNNITFNSSVGSAAGQNNSLTVNANDVGNVVFNGAVGENDAALGSLTVNTETGTISINGGSVNTSETQSYNSTLNLGADTNFIADIDNNSSGSFLVNFDRQINTNGNNINITAATIDIGSIDATDPNNVGGRIALEANSITTGNLTTNNNNITLNGATFLNRDITISTGSDSSGNINLNSTIDGNHQLNLEAGSGEVTLNGAVGNKTPVQALSVSASRIQIGDDITTNNSDLNFNNPVDLIDNATINVGEASINFNNQLQVNGKVFELKADHQINLPSASSNTNGGTISLQPNNLNRNVSVNGINSDGLSISNLNNLENLEFLNIGANNLNSTITVVNPLITDANITIEAANLILDADIIGEDDATVSLFANGSSNTTGLIDLGADINTTGSLITIDGDVVLSNNATISASGDINILGQINAASAGEPSLTIDADSGSVNLADSVGTKQALNSLTVDADSINWLSDESDAIQVNTTDIQTYNGDIFLAADATLISENGVIAAQSLNSFGNDVNISASAIEVGDLNTFAESVDTSNGGNVSLTSTTGAITTGNIDTTSLNNNAGKVSIDSATTVDTGSIVTFSSQGNAGGIELDAPGNITVGYLDAASESGIGGDVIITTQAMFFASDAFEGEIAGEDNPFSISTVGGEADGRVRIEHGGGVSNPFVVNFGQNVPASNNGTAGAITTNQTNIESGTFPFTEIIDNTAIISDIPQALLQNSDPSNNSAQSADPLRTAYVPSQSQLATLAETTEALRTIAQTTAVKPALIYVNFSPRNVSANFAQLEASLTDEYDQYLNAIETNINPNLALAPAANDTLELIVVSQSGEAVPVRVDVSRQEVLATAAEFYRQVEQLGDRYLAPAQQLYQWLVAPIEAELQAQGIENLIYVMPDGLRLVPLAALHDANTNQYLAQKYNSGLAPSVSLVSTGYNSVQSAPVLAMGASTFEPDQLQYDLAAVAVEIPLIVEQIREGEYFLDSEFTRENLIEARNKFPFPIVHLATHADFNPGDIENSYIQLYDSKLQLDELRKLQLHQPPVELLVISACRSAFGDTNAELGFAGLASQIGVKTVVASLWYVGDTGTLALMSEFYHQLERAPIKAEALRQAQVAMITGEVTQQSDQIVSSSGKEIRSVALPFDPVVTDDLSHPFFWAAFTMIGSPW